MQSADCRRWMKTRLYTWHEKNFRGGSLFYYQSLNRGRLPRQLRYLVIKIFREFKLDKLGRPHRQSLLIPWSYCLETRGLWENKLRKFFDLYQSVYKISYKRPDLYTVLERTCMVKITVSMSYMKLWCKEYLCKVFLISLTNKSQIISHCPCNTVNLRSTTYFNCSCQQLMQSCRKGDKLPFRRRETKLSVLTTKNGTIFCWRSSHILFNCRCFFVDINTVDINMNSKLLYCTYTHTLDFPISQFKYNIKYKTK